MTGSQLPWLAPNQRMATESEAASSEVDRHLHYSSRDATGADGINGRPLTAKGRPRRRRIVDTAADLMVERGVLAVSLDEVGRVTSTSQSQMYHYFASKDDLVAAVVTCVRDRILAFHGDLLVAVDSLEGLRGWADFPLEEAAALARRDRGLVVISTLRSNGTIQASLVNAGVIAHPATGETVLGLVTAGKIKLANLHARPPSDRNLPRRLAVGGGRRARRDHRPDDPQPWLDAEDLRQLRREIFAAAGGEHDNWDEYDRTMAEERRAADAYPAGSDYSNR